MFSDLNSRSLRDRPYLLNRRHPACFRFSYSQHCHASGTRRPIRGWTEQPRPHDGLSIRKDRPMPPLPYRYTEFLKKSLDLFLARAAYGLVLVPWPPISQNQAARQSTPVKITYPIIIYVMGRIGSFRFFNQFQGDFDARRFCADNPWHRSLNRIGTVHLTVAAQNAETKPFERAQDIEARRLNAPVALA